jgi:hypothetical protein
MHGFLWSWHRSHHEPRRGSLEKNDLFGLFFSAVAIGLLVAGLKFNTLFLAAGLGMAVQVCHFPPGTSKWNKIEHRLFSFISRNWRGRPLVSYEVIVSLIANTTNGGGLTVECAMDTGEYPKGVKVTDDEMAALALERDAWRGDWNYVISPLPHLEVVGAGR